MKSLKINDKGLKIVCRMKKIRLLFFLPAVAVSCTPSNRLQPSHATRIDFPVKISWLKKNTQKNPLEYYGGDVSSDETIKCNVECFLDNEMYRFLVMGKSDTVSFSISKYYIGTNMDSINIMMNGAMDTSSIYVFPYCSWTMYKRWFVKSTPLKDYCHITSTRPVHVAIFILVDVMKDNGQQSIYEKLKQDRIMKNIEGLDSIIESLPDTDNDTPRFNKIGN